MIARVQPVEFLRPNDVHNVPTLMEFAYQRIGCSKPIGHKARGIAIRRINEELTAQGWSLQHLIGAVQYMKAKGIKARTIDFILYHVEDAVKAGYVKRPQQSWDDLEALVSEAIYKETDQDWSRRLLSARGAALSRLYQQWVTERGSQFGLT